MSARLSNIHPVMTWGGVNRPRFIKGAVISLTCIAVWVGFNSINQSVASTRAEIDSLRQERTSHFEMLRAENRALGGRLASTEEKLRNVCAKRLKLQDFVELCPPNQTARKG